MKKVLVTGANGFIGSALLKVLSEEGVEVIAVVKDTNENISIIESLPNIKIVYCELSEVYKLSEIVTDRDIDVCIHLAWAGSFGDARTAYDLQLQNVKYALNLVDVLPKMNIKRFVGAGTLAERDVLNYHPTDGATPNAVSIYGIAKITANYMTKVECSKLGIEHVWCLLSNTYGVGNTTNNFVNMASRLMLENRRAAFTSGEQTYDFVYVTDTVKGIYHASAFGKANTSYYIGSDQARPLKEYIRIIRDTINPDIELYLGEIPFNGTSLSKESYDTTKLINDTGYHPAVRFEDGILNTINWLRDQIK